MNSIDRQTETRQKHYVAFPSYFTQPIYLSTYEEALNSNFQEFLIPMLLEI